MYELNKGLNQIRITSGIMILVVLLATGMWIWSFTNDLHTFFIVPIVIGVGILSIMNASQVIYLTLFVKKQNLIGNTNTADIKIIKEKLKKI